MTAPDLEALRKLYEGTTQGEWNVCRAYSNYQQPGDDDYCDEIAFYVGDGQVDVREEDCDFIDAAHNAFPHLLALLQAAEEAMGPEYPSDVDRNCEIVRDAGPCIECGIYKPEGHMSSCARGKFFDAMRSMERSI